MSTVQNAAIAGGIGWLVDRMLGTGPLGTIAGIGLALFNPEAGDLGTAYNKIRATHGEKLKNFLGFEMPEGLFGVPPGKTAEDMKPNRARAEANAKDMEKKTGFPWGKALLIGGGALLGLNVLDRVMSFGMPWFSPMARMGMQYGGNMGGPYPGYMPGGSGFGGGILPLALLALMGIRGMRTMC